MLKNEPTSEFKESSSLRIFSMTRKIFKYFLLVIIGGFILWLQLRYEIFQVLWKLVFS